MAFDPASTRFIIAYVIDPTNTIQFATLPTAGGAFAFTNFAGVTTWDNPGIACRGGTKGCRLVYRGTNYLLNLMSIGVNSNGTMGTPTITGVGLYAWGPAALAWSQAEQLFHLAFQGGFGTIYSYSLPATGTTWTGTGDIVNNSGIPVSAPSMATTTLLSYAWYVRWW